jgi:hypothetical protein
LAEALTALLSPPSLAVVSLLTRVPQPEATSANAPMAATTTILARACMCSPAKLDLMYRMTAESI